MNLFALALMASGLFFLDSYRARLVAERQSAAESQVRLLASSLAVMSDDEDKAALTQFARSEKLRVRLYDKAGTKLYDSLFATGPTFQLVNPDKEPFVKP